MSYVACAALVQRGDPDRFLATMAAPPARRGPLFTLYALNLEIARAPWVTAEPMIAEMRLQWWRDVVDGIAEGKPPRAHEVAGPLAEVIAAHDLPALLIDAMITARRWDIDKEPFADPGALDRHLDQTSGNLMWLAALTCGAPPTLESSVRDVGYGLGVANWLRAVPALAAQGRIPLLDGTDAGVAALAQVGLERLARARKVGFGTATAALLPAWQAATILRQVVANPRRVGDESLGTSVFRSKGSLLIKSLTGRW